jgi:hypothetical protein
MRASSPIRVAARAVVAAPLHIISPDHHLTDPTTGLYQWSVERVKAAWAKSITELDDILQAGGVTKVVLMVGIPASGKTTWLSKNAEPGAVYFDATFKDARARRPILDVARKYGVSVEAVVLNTPLDEALRRNNTRTPDRKVPESILRSQHTDLTRDGMPSFREGFHRITVIAPTS